MSIGQAMRHDLMPYRDVFDHKGPLLYLLQYFAAWVFPRSTTGVYMLLSLCLTVFLFFGYRIARIFLNVKASLVAAVLMQFSVVYSASWPFGKGAAEEYLLPGLTACLFYLVRFLSGTESERQDNDRKSILYYGASGFWIGTIFWIKFTPVPFLGLAFLALLIAMLIKRRFKTALKSTISMILGVVVISIPVVLYLLSKGILGDMWSGYIEFNLQYARGLNRLPASHTIMGTSFLFGIFAKTICAILGMIYLRLRSGKILREGTYIITGYILLTLMSLLMMRRNYSYYFLPLMPFLFFTWIALIDLAQKAYVKSGRSIPSEKRRWIFTAFFIVSISAVMIGVSLNSPIVGSRITPKSVLEKYADEINHRWEQTGNEEPPRILDFSYTEMGLMQLCDSYPKDRFFYMPAIYDEMEQEILIEQSGYIRNGLPDVILLFSTSDTTELIHSINDGYERLILNDMDASSGFYSNIYVYIKVDTQKLP
jgi:hypothetical protein